MIRNSVHNRVPILPRSVRTLGIAARSSFKVAVHTNQIPGCRAAVNQQHVVDPDIAVAVGDKAQHGACVSSIAGGIGIEAILILCPFGSQRSPRVQRHGGAERAAGGVEVGNLCIDYIVSRRSLCAERQLIEVTGGHLRAVGVGKLCCTGNLHRVLNGCIYVTLDNKALPWALPAVQFSADSQPSLITVLESLAITSAAAWVFAIAKWSISTPPPV